MTCDFNISTLISTAIATIVASSISLFVANKNKRNLERSKLLDYIMQINHLAIQYPYFEDDNFCNMWARDKCLSDEKFQRYENYCCIVFNLIEEMWRHFSGDKQKIEEFFGVAEMVKRHSKWLNDSTAKSENAYGYKLAFLDYIATY
jgi:hypothetical protein